MRVALRSKLSKGSQYRLVLVSPAERCHVPSLSTSPLTFHNLTHNIGYWVKLTLPKRKAEQKRKDKMLHEENERCNGAYALAPKAIGSFKDPADEGESNGTAQQRSIPSL